MKKAAPAKKMAKTSLAPPVKERATRSKSPASKSPVAKKETSTAKIAAPKITAPAKVERKISPAPPVRTMKKMGGGMAMTPKTKELDKDQQAIVDLIKQPPKQLRKTKPEEAPAAEPTEGAEESKGEQVEQPKGETVDQQPQDSKDDEVLELGLLLDCTGSMGSWIARAKKTLEEVIDNVIKEASDEMNLTARITVIGYRDHCDARRFEVKPFHGNVQECKEFINTLKASGGGDTPEDIVGALKVCLMQDWTEEANKKVFMICDAPPHGK